MPDGGASSGGEVRAARCALLPPESSADRFTQGLEEEGGKNRNEPEEEEPFADDDGGGGCGVG